MKTITCIPFSACKPFQLLKICINYLRLSLSTCLLLLFSVSAYAQVGQLFWTDGSLEQISAIDLDGSDRVTILEDLNTPTDIDRDLTNDKLYWVDRGAGRIQRSNLDGSNIETIVNGLTDPVGIAIDPSNQLIFWSDATDGTLSKIGFDGSNQAILLMGLASPFGVSLGNEKLYFTVSNEICRTDTSVATALKETLFDASDGLTGLALDISFNGNTNEIFWTKIDRIQSGAANGIGAITDIRTGISPTGIDLDLANALIYFTDPFNNTIKSMPITGLAAPSDIVVGLTFPRGIVSDGDSIYWVDQNDAEIEKAEIITGNSPETLIDDIISTVRGIALDGANGKFYWIDDGLDKIVRADLDGNNIEDVVNTGLNNPINLALDLANSAVYWTDASDQSIKKADLGGLNQNIMTILDFADGLRIPTGIALDLTENKLYWADRNTQTISRADLDGNNIEQILDNAFDGVDTPEGIAVDVNNGKIYWADGAGFIGEANLNGSNSDDTFITGITNPVSVVVDPVFGKIFFGTTGAGGDIRSANLDGSGVSIFLSSNINQPNGLALDAQLALPVSLSFFGGERINEQQVQLLWQTVSETDNLGFEIQRSYDGQAFERLGFVDGRGTFLGITNYSHILSENQAAFYRLKQIDVDGSSTFSPVIFVAGSEQSLTLRLFPNPGNGQEINLASNINLPNNSSVQINLYSSSGKLLLQKTTTWPEVSQALREQASFIPQGLYLLELQLLNQKHTLKWVKN